MSKLDVVALSLSELNMLIINKALDSKKTFIIHLFDMHPYTIDNEGKYFDPNFLDMMKIRCDDFDPVTNKIYGKPAGNGDIENYINDNMPYLFNSLIAKTIIKRVKVKKKKKRIIVVCLTGRTLSAAVAAGIDLLLFNNECNILENNIYKDTYNQYVYNIFKQLDKK